MHEINEQQLMELLRARTIIQRRLRVDLEKLETIENDIEQLIADAEGREPIKRFLSIEIRAAHNICNGLS
jgi:hypothetical protein